MRKQPYRSFLCLCVEEMVGLVGSAFAGPPPPRPSLRSNRRRPAPARCYDDGVRQVVHRRVYERETVEVIISADPSAYQSRHGIGDAPSLPMARLNMDANPVRRYPITPPNPVPELYRNSRRPESPDSSTAAEWPRVVVR